MTIGITGPRHRAPWRGAVMVLIIAGIVLSICLMLLGLTGDFLVDWLWFSTMMRARSCGKRGWRVNLKLSCRF
jgi:hypothetical protein